MVYVIFWRAIFSARKFTSRAEEPLGTYRLTEPVPKVVEFRPADGPEKLFWPIIEEVQPGDSVAFLHEVVFVIDRPA